MIEQPLVTPICCSLAFVFWESTNCTIIETMPEKYCGDVHTLICNSVFKTFVKAFSKHLSQSELQECGATNPAK
jgi:hypothetical protein